MNNQNNLIVHSADLHVRNISRHAETKEVFTRSLEFIKKIKPLCYAIVGDLFHNKLILSPEAFQLVQWYLDECSKITHVVIIPGNHDVNINNKSRTDGITVVLEKLNTDKIIYYKKNGIYQFLDTNIHFGVFSMIDEIKPEPIEFERKPGNIYIALYHGMINGSSNDSNHRFESKKDISMFRNYDITMLGDIHKYQYLNSAKTIAYPGSMFQQDFGESIDKGLLVWDVSTKESFFQKIKNDYSYLKINADDVDNIDNINLSKYVNVRITSDDYLDPISIEKIENKVRTKFAQKQSEIISYSFTFKSKKENIQVDSEVENISDVEVQNKILSEYLKNINVKDDIIEECIQLNRRMNASIEKSDFTISQWIPESLVFSNFFNYGEDNELDFKNLPGVTGICGLNESGKSSIFEVVYYSIFGDTARGTSLDKLVNFTKNNASSSIVLNSDGNRYQIDRKIKIEEDGKIRTSVKVANLDNENDETIPGSKNEIKDWIKNKFGLPRDFSEISLSSQFNIHSLVKSPAGVRGQLLLKFLGLIIFKHLLSAVKPEFYEKEKILSSFKKDEIQKEFTKWQVSIIENTKLIELKNDEINLLNVEIEKMDVEKSIIEKQLVEENIEIIDVKKSENEIAKLEEENSNKKSLISNYKQQNLIIETVDLERKSELESDIDKNSKEKNELLKSKSSKEQDKNSKNVLLAGALKSISIIDRQDWHRETEVCQKCSFLSNAFEDEKNYGGYKKAIEDIENEIKEIDDKILKNNETNDKIKEEYNRILKSEKDNIQKELIVSKISNLELEISNNEYKIVEIQNRIDAFNKKSDDIIKNKKLKEIIQEKSDSIKISKDKLSVLQNEANNIKVDLKVAAQKLEEINSRIDQLAIIEREYSIYETYFNAIHPDGLPKTILSRYINDINSKVNEILQYIVDWNVFLKINDKEEVEIIVKKPNGFESPADGNGSGMQVTLIGLAIRAALSVVSRIAKCRMIFFDEPINAFDAEKQKEIIKVFEYLKSIFPSIIVISHLELFDICNNLIHVEKNHAGYSKIVKS